MITDSRAAPSQISGNISWTQGTGYIPITLKGSDAQTFNLDLQDADYKDDTAFPMLSLCKLLKDDWKLNLTQDQPFAITPDGNKIVRFVGTVLPHAQRANPVITPS